MQWVIDRLIEPSTWQGLAAILTGVGVALSPEMWQAIGAAGVAIIGLVQVIKKERETPPTS